MPENMPIIEQKPGFPASSSPIAIPAAPAVAERVECLCVAYLRERLGVPIHGDADTLTPNTPLPDITIGTVVLFDYGNIQHAAVIISMHRDELTVAEANFKKCEEGIRTVKYSDPSIRGFFRP